MELILLDRHSCSKVNHPSQRKPEIVAQNVLGRLGNLTVKIADSHREIEAAQKLRHEVFSAECGLNIKERNSSGRDEDRFDTFCDHLIVVDEARPHKEGLPPVVATYRLLDQHGALQAGAFYSESEFRIASLIKKHPTLDFLEFGRSCVASGYRDKRTVELLWHGSWAYVRTRGIDVMFGCASFPGTTPGDHSASLAILANQAPASADWNVEAVGEPLCLKALIDRGETISGPTTSSTDLRAGLKGLPPIIKGYLGLGAMFATQASIDRHFGTIDVLVILPISKINSRYLRYFGNDANRHAVKA